jgi:hypothetical protein
MHKTILKQDQFCVQMKTCGETKPEAVIVARLESTRTVSKAQDTLKMARETTICAQNSQNARSDFARHAKLVEESQDSKFVCKILRVNQ